MKTSKQPTQQARGGLARRMVHGLTLALLCGGILGWTTPTWAQDGRDDDPPAASQTSITPLATGGCGGAEQVSRGFVIQSGLGGRLATVATATSPDPGAGLQWNLLVGYKICRFTVGVNLDVLVSSPAGSPNATTSVQVAPELQAALAQSSDHKAQLLGVLRLGLGSTGGFLRLAAMLGPGLRYWLHRHIALHSIVGLDGSLILQDRAGTTALLAVVGNVGLQGAF